MTTLLEYDSPLYLKRLARELNAAGWQSGKAFYCEAGAGIAKFNQARFSKGELQVRMCRGAWQTVTTETNFDDGNGNTVCASRKV